MLRKHPSANLIIFSLVEQVIKVKETIKFDIGIKRWRASIEQAIADPETVVIGLPNYLH
jgi:predicted dehydrogenase